MLTVGELFAGIGGIGLGLERTGGFQVKWQVEYDPYATRVLEKHWPNVRRWGDVTTFPPDAESGTGRRTAERGPKGRERDTRADGSPWAVDIITGGFPCQDISYAGKGAGLSGERSGLFYEVIRVARCLRPPAVRGRGLKPANREGCDSTQSRPPCAGVD